MGNLTKWLGGVVATSAISFGRGISRSGLREDLMGSRTPEPVVAMRLQTARQLARLDINKAVATVRVEQTATEDRIFIGFEDGSELRVRMKPSSVLSVRVEEPLKLENVSFDIKMLTGLLCEQDNNQINIMHLEEREDRLSFIRGDGTSVVLDLVRDGILGVEYTDRAAK